MESTIDRWRRMEREAKEAHAAFRADVEECEGFGFTSGQDCWDCKADVNGFAMYCRPSEENARRGVDYPPILLSQDHAVGLAAYITGVTTDDEGKAEGAAVTKAAVEGLGNPTVHVLFEIQREREHQVEMHYTDSVDDGQKNGQLVRCAAAYALSAYPPGASEILVKQTVAEERRMNLIMHADEIAKALWPHNPGTFRPANGMDPREIETAGPAFARMRRHDLVRAAALIVAEIERVDRAAEGSQ